MDLNIIESYDAARHLANKSFRAACYAPWVSLLLDPLGDARVCCKNYTYVLGNVARDRLAAIWSGQKVKTIRKALEKYNFNLGCDYCQWQIAEGDHKGAATREFDEYAIAADQLVWPQVIEFNISNTCNLECVMCNGEFSSLIRSHRENLPPLPKAYGEEFFEDLATFLPHLKLAKCLGGEPFLAQEMHRVWDMMIEAKLSIKCRINTNATTYNARVERVLENLPCAFQVSIDGMSAETFEAVRVRAKFDEVMTNFQRLLAYSRARPDGDIGITFCLMRQNWRDLGKILLFGDETGCPVSILPVVTPASCSLYTLPAADLAEIVHGLEAMESQYLPRLGQNAPVWATQLDRLRGRLAHQEGPRPVFVSLRLLEPFRGAENEPAPETDSSAAIVDAKKRLSDWSGGETRALVCDENDIVVDIEDGADDFFGVARRHCVGRRVDVVFAEIRVRHRGSTDIVRIDERPGMVDRVLSFGAAEDDRVFLRSITLPRWDEGGRVIGSLLIAAQSRELRPAAAAT